MKNLFVSLFGWTNGGVSKWKRLIKSIQSRVKILNNKRDSVIRQSTKDVVQLLINSEHQRALVRVDLLSKDQNKLAAYNILDQFCDLILSNLPYILQHKDYPSDTNEALSSLIYASARCGDLPELMELRKLFGRRFGENFVRVAVELLPGNLVNPQVIEMLSVKSISHDVKFRLMKQIATDNGLELGPPDIDCKLELRQDQRVLLMLKSTSTQPQGDNRASLSDLNECDHFYTDDDPQMKTCEKSVEKTSSWNTAKKRKSTRRRLNRRCNQIEHELCSGSTSSMSFNVKDMESEMYYKKELNRRWISSKTSHRKKLMSTEQRYCEQRKQKEERYSVEDNFCSERPCYFVTSEDRDDWDCPTPRSDISQTHTPKIRREVYKKEIESCASSSGSHSKKMSPLTTSQTRPHPTYLRTSMTMPPRERPKDVVLSDQIVKSASCEFPHSKGSSFSPCHHIHPKLPDCDELANTFKAFKEEYIQSVIEEFSKEEYIQSVIEDFQRICL